jgi:integrating conjugative element protein (TIGR03765 family)
VPVGPLLAQAAADASPGAAVEVVYPVRTPGLVPGRLVGQPRWPHAQWLTQPLFLVGADEASRRWLRRHRAALQAMGASGLLVQARSAADLAAVQQEAPGILIAAAASPWLLARLRELNAAVLPLLIRADGVLTQQPQA